MSRLLTALVLSLLFFSATHASNDVTAAVFTADSVILLDGKQIKLKDLPAETVTIEFRTKVVQIKIIVIVDGMEVEKLVPQKQVVLLSVRSR